MQFNYHVELREDRHFCSVPWQFKGKRVRVIYDDRIVTIYYDNIRIAQHFNRAHASDGHLFKGRYKFILVDADSYLSELMNSCWGGIRIFGEPVNGYNRCAVHGFFCDNVNTCSKCDDKTGRR